MCATRASRVPRSFDWAMMFFSKPELAFIQMATRIPQRVSRCLSWGGELCGSYQTGILAFRLDTMSSR